MDVATDVIPQEVYSVTREQIKTRAEAEFDKARKSFWAFRLAIHPELIQGRVAKRDRWTSASLLRRSHRRQTSEAGDRGAAAARQVDGCHHLRITEAAR
jgi:hypothetical protein